MSDLNVKSEREALSFYRERIQDLYETDIGDFKRKIISYLNRLEECLKDSELKLRFLRLKEAVICNETLNIEELRIQSLKAFH